MAVHRMRDRKQEFLEDTDLEALQKGAYEIQGGAVEPALVDEGFAHNWLNQYGLLYEPIVDEYREASGGDRPTWPNGADFAVCLTHDVDLVHPRRPRDVLRAGYRNARIDADRGDWLGALGSALGHAVGAVRIGRPERTRPGHYFESWLDAEDEVDANSTFFFTPESTSDRHRSDTVYRYDDTVQFEGAEWTVADLQRELHRRGNEIGLHAAHSAYDDADEMERQRLALERASGTTVRSVRQHWLFHDVRRTPATQAAAGLEFDSTLAVTGNVGFRFGTSRPWYLHDHRADERLSLLEIPLIAQDTALFDDKYMGLDREEAVRYVRMLGERVADVGGVLTLNWHPNSPKPGDRLAAYRDALHVLSESGAWFGTVEEIGDWWRDRHQENWYDE